MGEEVYGHLDQYLCWFGWSQDLNILQRKNDGCESEKEIGGCYDSRDRQFLSRISKRSDMNNSFSVGNRDVPIKPSVIFLTFR